MSNLNRRNEWIDWYCTGELCGAEREYFDEILKTDTDLQLEVEVERQIYTVFSDPGVLEFRKVVITAGKKIKIRRWNRRLLVAATIATVMTMGSVFYYQLSVPFRNDRQEAGIQSHAVPFDLIANANREIRINETGAARIIHKKMSGDNLEAENFKPYPYMEGLVGEETRSVGFNLLTPAYRIEIRSGDSICYQWEPDSKEKFRLELVNNQGLPVKVWMIADPKEFCIQTNELSAGLYYWKLIRSTELLCVGRFVLK